MNDQATNAHEFSVSELAGAIKRTVEDAFGSVRVRGELGRVVTARSGHLYMDLKDEKAVISSVMWKGVAASILRFQPEEGLEVIAEGKLSTFAGQSKYQLIIERLEPAGEGALMALLEERKRKLAAAGLFDPAKKRRPPFLPEVIGVVTSPSGAVIRDILHRLRDRFPRHVLLWPVLVQGDKAANEIAAAITGFNHLPADGPVPRPDIIIVARGGGSIEDLWAFNEEVVVRAAAGSDIPLISAVGHETDVTLIDFAADLRAPTPTGAAEMAVPVRAELAAEIGQLEGRLHGAQHRLMERRGADLRSAARALPRPADLLGLKAQRFDGVAARLAPALRANASRHELRLREAAARLRPEALGRDVKERARRVQELTARAWRGAAALMETKRRGLERAAGLMEAFNPKSVLGRGFALITDAKGAVVRAAASLSPGDQVGLEFADGRHGAVIGGAAKTRRRKTATNQGDLF